MVGRITMMTEGSRQEGSRERALVRMSREQTAAPIELPRCTCTPCCALPVGVSDSDALCDAMEVDLRRQASHRVHYVLQTLADFHATATAMHQKRDTAMHKRSGTSVRPEQRKNNAKRETIVTPPSSQNVDWADGLSTDIFGEIVQRAGLSATGACAAVCRSFRAHAERDDIWAAHVQAISGGAIFPRLRPGATCRTLCELICTHRKLGFWLQRVRNVSETLEAEKRTVRERLADAGGRLSKLQNGDYREAQQLRRPPAEFAVAGTLLRALLTADDEGLGAACKQLETSLPSSHTVETDGAPEPCSADETAVAWLQAQLPQISSKHKAIAAQGEVARFLSTFHRHQSEPTSPESIASVIRTTPLCEICLRQLQYTIQYTDRTQGRGSPQVSALIVASAVIRWVVALVGLTLLSERELPLQRVLTALQAAALALDEELAMIAEVETEWAHGVQVLEPPPLHALLQRLSLGPVT